MRRSSHPKSVHCFEVEMCSRPHNMEIHHHDSLLLTISVPHFRSFAQTQQRKVPQLLATSCFRESYRIETQIESRPDLNDRLLEGLST